MTARFRYLLDPVFIGATALYLLNRYLMAPSWGSQWPVLTNHVGDTLLIPCALPPLLWLQRLTRLRLHDRPPTPAEIFGTLVLWSFLFEWLFPVCFGRGVSDPLDVLAYALGALVAYKAWRHGYR
jgi:hypothetical protein